MKKWWFWAIVAAVVLYYAYSKGWFTIPALNGDATETSQTQVKPGDGSDQFNASGAQPASALQVA